MTPFHYVYLLVSETDSSRHYTGLTQDLEARLLAHNAGQVSHTLKFRLGGSKTPLSSVPGKKAATFESYLKNHSGRAFAIKHF
jgi:predicted GIY-YIG superfamily endonuclease